MKRLWEVIEDRNGYISFKRATAIVAFFVAVYIALAYRETELVREFLIYSGGCGALATIPDNIRKLDE